MKIHYLDGTDMRRFKHLKDISSYNQNYYAGFFNDLIYGESDDDNTTDWWIVSDKKFQYLGYSFTSEKDALIKSETKPS